MPYYFFIWTPEIIDHLAEHDVTPEEFEEVVSDPDYEDVSRSTGNPIAFGSNLRRAGSSAASSNGLETI